MNNKPEKMEKPGETNFYDWFDALEHKVTPPEQKSQEAKKRIR